MKSTLFAAAVAAGLLAAATTTPAAEPPQVPKHACDPKPVMPGPTLRQDPMVVRRLQRDIDRYRDCMKAYADERAAHSKAHTDAGNAAINEYNATMKELQDQQKGQ